MKKQNTQQSEAAPDPNQVITEKEIKPIKYVVVRDGYRVSDREYPTVDDPLAVAERDFWSRVATRHSYGEPVLVVQYDSKRHRVW